MSLWSLGARTRTRPTCPVRCAHCGLPAPAPCFREGSENGPAFCCRACRQVYDLVRELSAAEPINEERPFARAD
jgi:hypothetical protein